MDSITIRFGDDLAPRVERAAALMGQSMGDFIRDHLERILRQAPGDPVAAGPRKPQALKVFLAHDFAHARTWGELHETLRRKGYELMPVGRGLVICTLSGERLCRASEIGQHYSILQKRFRAPFPMKRQARRTETADLVPDAASVEEAALASVLSDDPGSEETEQMSLNLMQSTVAILHLMAQDDRKTVAELVQDMAVQRYMMRAAVLAGRASSAGLLGPPLAPPGNGVHAPKSLHSARRRRRATVPKGASGSA